MRMLGQRPMDVEPDVEEPSAAQAAQNAFGVEERNMVSGVLTLAERSIHSIMTPRTDVTWINLEDDPAIVRQQIETTPHSFFPVCRGALDEIVGIGRAKNLVADLITQGRIDNSHLREPIIVHESIDILRLMDILKRSRGQLVLVADEFGTILGLVTPIDVFEAIAGEFPDEDEMPDIVVERKNVWRIDGAADLHHVEQVLETDGLVDDSQDYTTLAGYLLARFGQLPKPGDTCEYEMHYTRFRFVVLQIENRRIASVQVEKFHIEPEEPGGSHEDQA
jgi:CBS domain containing-hemolysin-like protein